jgi:hypothetical protein
MNLTELYQKDAHAWYFANAKMLREKRFEEIDLDNLIEEMESMGRNERNTLKSFFVQLFLHLLKWQYQPERQGSSWQKSIRAQRNNIMDHLKDNPSLKSYLDEIVKNAYVKSCKDAAIETDLDISFFPDEMPFTLEQALDDAWLPE